MVIICFVLNKIGSEPFCISSGHSLHFFCTTSAHLMILFYLAVMLCWVTQDFELYATFDPLADKVRLMMVLFLSGLSISFR